MLHLVHSPNLSKNFFSLKRKNTFLFASYFTIFLLCLQSFSIVNEQHIFFIYGVWIKCTKCLYFNKKDTVSDFEYVNYCKQLADYLKENKNSLKNNGSVHFFSFWKKFKEMLQIDDDENVGEKMETNFNIMQLAVWQGKPSAYLWLWLHFAAATATNTNDETIIKHIIYILFNLDLFIMCGICKSHYIEHKKILDYEILCGTNLNELMVKLHFYITTCKYISRDDDDDDDDNNADKMTINDIDRYYTSILYASTNKQYQQQLKSAHLSAENNDVNKDKEKSVQLLKAYRNYLITIHRCRRRSSNGSTTETTTAKSNGRI
nr:hypothetical protein [Microctonus hyperodae filamentous virus]